MEKLLTPKELAAYAGWPVRRIRNLILKKRIRYIQIGGKYFAPKSAIDEFIQDNMVEPCLGPAQDCAKENEQSVEPSNDNETNE